MNESVDRTRVVSNNRDPDRIKKTLQQSQTMAFTTQLFYFAMKVLFCYILYKYHNLLTGDYYSITNTYFIVTTGKNPGYQSSGSSKILLDSHSRVQVKIQQQITDILDKELDKYCDICQCQKKLRTKHCFRCGKCVRKFDHHCPWIGTCVGQSNHFKFLLMLFMQCLQSVTSFIICFKSLSMYSYRQQKETKSQNNIPLQSYSQQFGVFSIFSIFMFFYILFVGGLFLFHLYLIGMNVTTTELTKRSKAKYLKGIKGNPFDKGIFQNILSSIQIPENGHQWMIPIQYQSNSSKRKKNWVQLLWSNQYYDCC